MNATVMLRIVARLEKILNPEDDLAGWSITRASCAITVVLTYRSGVTHTIPISTADPDFINASL